MHYLKNEMMKFPFKNILQNVSSCMPFSLKLNTIENQNSTFREAINLNLSVFRYVSKIPNSFKIYLLICL